MKRLAIVLFLCVLLLTVLLRPPVSAEESQITYTPEQLLEIWQQVIALMRESECYPYVELQKGDRGYEVVFLQMRLAQLNYYGKAIDPQFGSGTEKAMRLFEKSNALEVDGIASIEDQKALFRFDAISNTGTAVGLENGQTLPPVVTSMTPQSPTPKPTPRITIWPGFQTIKPLASGLKLPDLTTAAPTPKLTPKPTLKPTAKLQTLKPLASGLKLPDLTTAAPTPTPTPKITKWPGLQTIKPLATGLNLPNLITPKPSLGF